MALTLLFADGFDTYNSLALLWDTPGTDTSIDLTGTISRTGLGCCKIISSAFGPTKTLNANYGSLTVSGALNPGGVVPSNNGQIFRVSNGGSGPLVILHYLPDLSLGYSFNNGPITILTSPGLFNVNAYQFVSLRVKVGTSGSIKVWLNGVVVADVSGINFHSGTDLVNTVQLMVFGGTTTGLWDDVTVWSCDPAVDDFAYMPSIYAAVPVSDSAPLQWTPNSGVTHYTQVSAVPQNTSNFVSDATVGQIDQYIHAIPVNQQNPPLPAFPTVLGACHNLLAELDVAGAHSIASNKAGAAGPTNFPLSVSPLIYQQPYTPGLANYSDLATTPFGPEVTA